MTAVEKRLQAAAKRKMEADEWKLAEKAAKAAAAKEPAAWVKIAAAEVAEESKAKFFLLTLYTSMLKPHQDLVILLAKLTPEKAAEGDAEEAQRKIQEGDAIMNECLEALKTGSEIDRGSAKGYVASLRPVTTKVEKLLRK